MSSLHIVLDSTANVPAEMLKTYPNIHIVPLKIILGNSEWNELDITNADLFRLAKEKGVHPQTSQPAPGDFEKVFAPVAEGHPVIMISLSGGLSGTVNGARSAAREFKGNEIYVIDSCTAAIGVIRMAEAAIKLAEEGMNAKAIAERIETMARNTRTLFIPDSLEFLHKGGRIGGAAALFGSILQIKPILRLNEGRVEVLDKVRTRQRAVLRMLEELDKEGGMKYIGILHGEAPALAEEIYNTVCQRYPGVAVSLSAISPVLSAHLGPGVVGIIFEVEK